MIANMSSFIDVLNSSQMIVKFIVDDPNNFVKLLEKEF